MYYFDNEYLKQYLNKHSDLQVFVNSEFYTITSVDDIKDREFGVAYDIKGQPITFDYKFIEQIKIGDVTYTKEQLQKSIAGEEEPNDETKTDDPEATTDKDSDVPKDDEPEEEEDPKSDISKSYEEGAEARFRIGQSVINEDVNDYNYGTKGRVNYINREMVTYAFYCRHNKRVVNVVKNAKYLSQI